MDNSIFVYSPGKYCLLNKLFHSKKFHVLATNIGFIPLELKHLSRDVIHKARDAYLIERGQTLQPKGILKQALKNVNFAFIH